MKTGLVSNNYPSICYILPSYSPEEASHMVHLPRFLSELGKYCNVHIIIQRGKGNPKISNVKSVYIQKPGNHLQRAIELIRLAYQLHKKGCHKFFVRISASAALELGFLSWFLNIQVYYWLSGQGKYMKPSWRGKFIKRIKWEFSNFLFNINLRLVQYFVTGPESMVDYFIKEYQLDHKQVILLYNDIDINNFRQIGEKLTLKQAREQIGLPLDQHVILSTGRVSKHKGGHYLVKLARQLMQLCPGALIVSVGHIRMPEILESAKSEGLKNIYFAGAIPHSKIRLFYRSADVFIMPSDEEGFPRKLLEAQAMGLPVVVFDVGGVRDIVHQDQLPFVLPRGDIEGMAEKVTMLLADPALRDHQANLGLDKVKQYSTESVAKMFFERIVSR